MINEDEHLPGRNDPERSDERGESPEQMALNFRKKIYASMMRSRGAKYRIFLHSLRAVRYLSCQPQRAELLESIYAFMRFLDDIVDGDAPVPEGFPSAAEYLEGKIAFARDPRNPRDAAEHLLQYCVECASAMGEDFSSEIDDVLQSLLFDAQRRNQQSPEIISQERLHLHFHMLDIRGTIGACLKIAHETEVHYSDLEPLGEGARIFYTLRDFEEDAEAGYCNIPIEDIQAFGISDQERQTTASSKIQAWFRKEALRGMAFLQAYRDRASALPLRRFTKVALWWIFEKPAAKYFQRILQNG